MRLTLEIVTTMEKIGIDIEPGYTLLEYGKVFKKKYKKNKGVFYLNKDQYLFIPSNVIQRISITEKQNDGYYKKYFKSEKIEENSK